MVCGRNDLSFRPQRRNREPGDLPSVPGEKPILGRRPVASTEVVMAEDLFSRVRVGRALSFRPDACRCWLQTRVKIGTP